VRLVKGAICHFLPNSDELSLRKFLTHARFKAQTELFLEYVLDALSTLQKGQAV
jgi:hypothetical protein